MRAGPMKTCMERSTLEIFLSFMTTTNYKKFFIMVRLLILIFTRVPAGYCSNRMSKIDVQGYWRLKKLSLLKSLFEKIIPF